MNDHDLSRRKLLGLGAAGLAVTAFGTPMSALAQVAKPGKSKKAKNIILCISDGMSVGIPTMWDHYCQLEHGKKSYWAELFNKDYVINGLQDTRSLGSLVTDSSAASSSWGSGRHIWNGMVNAFPKSSNKDEFIPLRPLMQILKEDGRMGTGLVTTATITHATPAGCSISHVSRDEEWIIAERYLDAELDVLMGGGAKFFDAEKRKDKKDLFAAFARKGYTICRTAGDLKGAQGAAKLLGIFSDSHMPYTVDRDHDTNLGIQTPTLKDMALVALQKLKGNSHGFFLQIEGARVDHGAHTDDMAAALYDQGAFEDAVKAAVEFALKDGETLVVISSDHGNANPGLTGSGEEYFDSTAGLKSLSGMTASYSILVPALVAGAKSASDIQDLIQKYLGLKIDGPAADFILSALVDLKNAKTPNYKKTYPLWWHEQYDSLQSAISIAIQNWTSVGWTGRSHTSDYVLVSAVGPGSENFRGLTQNTSWFNVFLAQRGLKHENPKMSFDEAYAIIKSQGAKPPEDESLAHWL